MQVISLQSGSNGNCIYVEARGIRLLFDAGISGAQARQRMGLHGRDIQAIDALVISHDHRDHTQCLGVYQRQFGLPVWITERTLAAARKKTKLGALTDVRHFRSGSVLEFGGVSVETIPTPHDGADGVAFVVDDGTHRVGILTDLGHVFQGLASLIGSLDGLLIESNFDSDMLSRGAYPDSLKRRIRGPGGHLSNREAAEVVACGATSRLKWLCLAHLSAENNRHELALDMHRAVLGSALPMHIAGRYTATDVLELEVEHNCAYPRIAEKLP